MKRLLSASIISLLLTSSLTWAAETGNQSMISKAGQQGMEAMKDIQFARLAIFGGQPELAKDLVNKAQLLLKKDQNWYSAGTKSKKTLQPDDFYVVIDSSLMLTEDFSTNDEKKKAIQKANSHLSNGDKKGAIETLHLAGIDVSETQLLMPLKQTIVKVDKAKEMLDDGKYYEANLALKGAEDGMITDTETIIDN
ncbi:TPA: YfdX family protein [Escherichia coli]